MSCHSCHTDGHTNGLLSDTLGDGSYGAPKRVPSLLGVAATGPWTWTGSMDRLEDQVRKSIATTMHGTKPTESQVADLTAYLATLAPPSPRLLGRRARTIPPSLAARRSSSRGSARAATSRPSTRRPERYDVGLVDEVGNHEFNPPSLRAVSRRDAFFHDGRTGRSARCSPGSATRGDSSSRRGRSTTSWRSWGRYSDQLDRDRGRVPGWLHPSGGAMIPQETPRLQFDHADDLRPFGVIVVFSAVGL